MDFYKLASLAGDMQHNAARDISRLIILGEDAKPALRKLLTGPEPGIHELVENHLSAHWSVILEEEGWEAAEFSWQANSPISIRVK